jgi:hypothetical protein
MGFDADEIAKIAQAAKDLRMNTPNSSKVVDGIVGSENGIKNVIRRYAEDLDDELDAATHQYKGIKKVKDDLHRKRRNHE